MGRGRVPQQAGGGGGGRGSEGVRQVSVARGGEEGERMGGLGVGRGEVCDAGCCRQGGWGGGWGECVPVPVPDLWQVATTVRPELSLGEQFIFGAFLERPT